MEFAENNRISHRQLYRQMILGFLAPFWLCMSGRGKLNGVDAVIGMVIAVVLLCFYVVFLIRLAPAFEDLKKTAGAFMGRVTGAFFLLFILLAGGYLLALLQEVVPISLITGISGRWIAFWAILTCAVGAHKGMQRRGRIAEVSGGLLLAGILLMMVLCIPQGKAAYLEEMVQSWNFSGEKILWSGYGVVCAFSAVGLLPFLLGNVEKYGSAGKSVMFGIITLGGILAGMEILLPAVLGYGRVQAERYPVLPLLDGADLPGNVLARFDVLWLGFLLYSLLFALGSLLHYGHEICRKAHLGNGRFWIPAVIYLISLIEENGKGIMDYFGWYLGYVFVPGLLLCQMYLFFRGKGRHRKKAAAVISTMLFCMLFLGGCASAVEPEKRMYPLALGVDASAEGISAIYGMPDLSQSTGQKKSEEDGGARVLQISGQNFQEIENVYDRSQEKFLDMGHLQVLVLGETILKDGRWKMVLDYLKDEPFVGEDLYIFRAENVQEILSWQGEDNSSLGEYLTGLIENRMSEKNVKTVTLRDVFYEKYQHGKMPDLPQVSIVNGSLIADL